MSEQEKEKKLFYIQLMENFFESDELIMIEDSALDKGEDPTCFQMIYLKLILKSLANDGLIKSDTVLTPQLIKTKIRFKTNRKREADLKTIDEAIKTFEELGLIIISNQALFVKKALELTMTKQEESQKRFLERRRNKVLIDELQLKLIDNLSPEEKEKIIFDKKVDEEWLPGLQYCRYITSGQEQEFKYVFEELIDSALSFDEIDSAMKIFIKRSLEVDYNKVVDKHNYLYKTLYNIAINEVRSCDSVYDLIIDVLIRKNVINGAGDLKNVLGIFSRFEISGFSKEEIRKAALQAISDNITIFTNHGISTLEKHLEYLLKKGDEEE